MRGRPSPARHWCSAAAARSPLAVVTSLDSLFTADKGSTSFFDRSLLCVFFIAGAKRAPRVLFSRRLIFAFLLIGDFLRRVFYRGPCAFACVAAARAGPCFLAEPVLTFCLSPCCFSSCAASTFIFIFSTSPYIKIPRTGVVKTESNVGVSGCVFFVNFNVF